MIRVTVLKDTLEKDVQSQVDNYNRFNYSHVFLTKLCYNEITVRFDYVVWHHYLSFPTYVNTYVCFSS